MDSIAPALIAGAVTAAGWIVTYRLTKTNEDRTRRLQTTMGHLQRQIEEFYGPIYSLVEQIRVAFDIQSRLTHKTAEGQPSPISAEQARQIKGFFQETYFIPLHAEILNIIKTKLYLVDGVALPNSFYDYQRHACQEKIQRKLWTDGNIDTRHLRGTAWPPQFEKDVEKSLKDLMERYELTVQNLKHIG